MPRTSSITPMGIRKGQFRSLLEARIGEQLEAAGVEYSYESVKLPYVKHHVYTPDFVLPNGIHVEVKGWFLPEDRGKLLLVKQQYPDLDIRLLFGNAKSKLSKKSKTTYAAWCDKHGFPWADKHLPAEWLQETK